MIYKVWTDGSFKSSINQGGYSSIITCNDKIICKLYQGFINTTNNRMELMGVLETLKYFKHPVNLIIYSDSQYVLNSINNKHLNKWILTKDISKKNLDIWVKIYELLKIHVVKFEWVKGHAKNKYNNLADLYACHAAECINLEKDLKYE